MAGFIHSILNSELKQSIYELNYKCTLDGLFLMTCNGFLY